MTKFRYLLPFFILTLAACATKTTRLPDVPEQPKPATESPQNSPPPSDRQGEPQPAPKPKNGDRGTKRPTAAPTTSPALLALMQEAESESASGNLENAAATLERAIRIQPRQPELWQKLAEVRLQQHQPGLAEDLAKKSNVLAKGNAALIRKNWAIIADARRKKGDAEGAAEADAKAGR